ncbi:MAG: alkaline phosphatase family protein [Acidobacteria bacterium]|nr:alkaline phosphatase family protein [Acidobacteriota bacterium]
MSKQALCGYPAIAVAGALSLTLACGAPKGGISKVNKKLVVIGFDGMDPDLVQRWMDEGQLPNMKSIVDRGGLYTLETTPSPESPTAWASFATGVNAGKHNIYDFLVRDTKTYLPDLGMVRREPPTILLNSIIVSKPKVFSRRGGTSFWVTAGREGVRASILTVPVTYPPEDVPNGELLAGLPLPDIRDRMGTFSYFATDLSRYEEGNTEFGGILKRLVFDGNVARTELVGPPNLIVRGQMQEIHRKGRDMTGSDKARLAELEAIEDVRLPMTIRWNRDSPDPKTATIEISGESLHLREGQWSKWIDLDFRVNFLFRLQGMVQLYLMKAAGELQLYVSPVNWKPDNPPLPISSPESLSGDLYERLGPYRTLGWAEATWPLEEGRIDEKTFMDDLFRAFDDRAQVILNRMDAGNWDLLVGVIESTDRVQHMMWRLIDPEHPMYDKALARRFGDSIERVYRRSDQFIAEVLERLPPDVPIMIVSDHGFHSWRRAVNLNTWLAQQGFMMLRGRTPGGKKLVDLFGGGQFWENVDWSRSRAYAMGLGQIYFNVRGREAMGTVASGGEYIALATELSARLLNMTDPENGARIVRSVYKRGDIYKGPYLKDAADLQVGFEDGYRVSWQTMLGGSPQGIVHANEKRWSADHGSFDFATTAGVFITNRKVASGAPRIIDIAPTVLSYFGVPIPKDLDGSPVY